MGFDASVISGVVGFIEPEFGLSKLQLGWSVASLTLTATIAMMGAGPLSDRIGRRPVLRIAAALFAVSAVASAVAPNFITLVLARMLGGLGVGAALIIAPMYIAEIAPPHLRGRLVSFNQLNIVVGISAAFFSNYLILILGKSDNQIAQLLNLGGWHWRWMLGVETLPALLYLGALWLVPESPRWLAMRGRDSEALAVFTKVAGEHDAGKALAAVTASVAASPQAGWSSLRELFAPAMRFVLLVGVSVAVLQQITGINSVFFYAPMIFEQSGIGKDAAFMQAVLIGLVNLVFTVLAILLIDKIGRRPLLGFGLTGITVCMFVLAWGFASASYKLDASSLESLLPDLERTELLELSDERFDNDRDFRRAMTEALGEAGYQKHESELVRAAIVINPGLILFGILGFVASFAVSLGPVMWVLFSELFPNKLRGIAISFAGLINSSVSFGVQLLFPWQLETLGNAATFMLYGLFALAGLVFVVRIVPETKGRSLEALQNQLVQNRKG